MCKMCINSFKKALCLCHNGVIMFPSVCLIVLISVSCVVWLFLETRIQPLQFKVNMHGVTAFECSSNPVSFLLHCRVMSVCVTPAGRGSSANKKLMNVYHSPAKTTPPAQTFSTATSRYARGRCPHEVHQSLNKCRERRRSEIAICPSTGSWG